MNTIEGIAKYGKEAQGRRALIKHLEGGRLTTREMVISKCFECMGWYTDGRVDCEIPDCPCYPLMPYGKGKYTVRTSKPLSEGHKAKMHAALKAKRAI